MGAMGGTLCHATRRGLPPRWRSRPGRCPLGAWLLNPESLTRRQPPSVLLQLLLFLSGTCSALYLLATLMMISFKSKSGRKGDARLSPLPP